MATETLPPPAGSASRTLTAAGIAHHRRSTSSSRCTTSRPSWPPPFTGVHDYLSANLPYRFRITIADNASTDLTPEIADRLAPCTARGDGACTWPRRAAGAPSSRRGRRSDAVVLAYMDVDLSTDLAALLPLVAPLLSGHSDLAIGTRLHRGFAGGARRQARGHLALLQPVAARHPRRALLRRPVRFQGDPG